MLLGLIRKYKDNVVMLGRTAEDEMEVYKCLDVLVYLLQTRLKLWTGTG
jgi:hypothetical protein